MKTLTSRRIACLSGVALVGSLALSACGSDNNTSDSAAPGASSSGSSSANTACAKGTLNGEGSSAQKNAIEEAIRTFQESCDGATVNYDATGSGAGIKQFIAGQVDFGGSDSALKTVAADGKVGDRGGRQGLRLRRPGTCPWSRARSPFAYNLKGVDKLDPDPRRRRQDLQRHHHHAGTTRPSPRSTPG